MAAFAFVIGAMFESGELLPALSHQLIKPVQFRFKFRRSRSCAFHKRREEDKPAATICQLSTRFRFNGFETMAVESEFVLLSHCCWYTYSKKMLSRAACSV